MKAVWSVKHNTGHKLIAGWRPQNCIYKYF